MRIRRRFAAWILAALLLAAGAIVGLRWADEPLHRRHELLRAPIRLVEGNVVRGNFTPEHDGPIHVEVCFPRPLAEVLGANMRETVEGGLQVSCTIRRGTEVAFRHTTEDGFPGWGISATEIAVWVASWGAASPALSTLEVRVDRAAPELADVGAFVRVAPSGDWINYAWMTAGTRRVFVLGGTAVLLVAALLAAWRRARSPRPSAAA